MGAEEGPEGPKFCPIGILIVRWQAQLCQNRGTVFLQRESKEKPGRWRARTLRKGQGKGEKGNSLLFQSVVLQASCWAGSMCEEHRFFFRRNPRQHECR